MSRSVGVRSLRSQKTALWMNIGVSYGVGGDASVLRRLTFEFTRGRKRAKPAVGRRVQRRVRPRHLDRYALVDSQPQAADLEL